MSAPTPRSVLIVDDHDDLAELMERRLRESGYTCARAPSGQAAAATLKRSSPGLLILDLHLPDMPGDQLVESLAAAGKAVPYVVVTGRGDERLAVTLLQRGALDYLPKDGNLLELLPGIVERAFERIDQNRRLAELEVELARLRDRHEMILNAAGEGICGLDDQGRISFLNPAGERLLGRPADELLGHPLTALTPPRPRSAHDSDRVSAHRFLEVSLTRGDGSVIPVEYTITPIRRDGRQIGTVFVFRDISQRRELEEQVRQSQKLEAVGRLAGGVAHDFNNLLTVILGYAEVLTANESLNERAREAVAEICQAAERASAVTRKLLSFGRKQVVRPVPLNLSEIVRGVEKLLGRMIGEDIRVVTDLADDVGILADPAQVEQILVNLSLNARDAMPRGGRLTIRTSLVGATAADARTGLKPGRYARLSVSDTGVGMDEATQARLFEPFFTTKKLGPGVGLGLATVHGIVAAAGGAVEVRSAIDQGSTFTVYWPEHRPGADVVAHPPSGGTTFGGDETILLVEDEDVVRQFAARVLGDAGYTVWQARSAAEAALVLSRQDGNVDLLVSDLIMPGESGLELARRLVPRVPGLRVLLMTGYPGEVLSRRGAETFEFPMLHKPFTPEALSAAVRRAIDHRPSRD